jgi:hypothetical protein
MSPWAAVGGKGSKVTILRRDIERCKKNGCWVRLKLGIESGDAMLKITLGQYVRLVRTPRTYLGTVTAFRRSKASVEYLFHHDPRFDDKLPDFRVFPYEIEACERTINSEVLAVNRLMR